MLRCPTPLPALYVGSDYAFCSIEKIKGSIWLKNFNEAPNRAITHFETRCWGYHSNLKPFIKYFPFSSDVSVLLRADGGAAAPRTWRLGRIFQLCGVRSFREFML